MAEPVDIDLTVDTRQFEDALKHLQDLSESFGRQLGGALKTAVTSGTDLEDTLRRIGLRLADTALEKGLSPLKSLLGDAFGSIAGALPALFGFASGGVPGSVVPFADGGVVSSPTFFPMGRNLGLMGEAGAEAILPLQRGPDGRLGVSAGGAGGGVNVVFNATASDAASFRKSEAQITGMLARAVSRGARTI